MIKWHTYLLLLMLFFIVFALIFSVIYLFANGFGIGMEAENTFVFESLSPDGNLKAVVFERNAGATTDFSTQLSILRSNEAYSGDAGNALIADSDHGKSPIASWGGPEIRVKWQATNKLLIEHHIRARIFRAEPKIENVQIEYKTFF